MRNILAVLFFALIGSASSAQLFSKERLANLETFDARTFTFGYYLGINNYDFKFIYENETGNADIFTERQTGFNVGLVGDMRLNEFMNLRLEPGLVFNKRVLTFPGDFEFPEMAVREVPSTYVYVPLLLKVSTKRLNNFKPFVVGGFSYAYNLSSNQDNPDDNLAGEFRMKTNTVYYELGLGIDLYLYYFKFTPSIRGVFSLSDELVPDEDPNSIYTSNIDQMLSRGVFINFTFQ
ncbi:type IX secretion/gliding motility protein PorT/SprT [Croceiramulus getboli]|nr:porin family protein [Flavobacteriaceae bacterium YJPT1-3]